MACVRRLSPCNAWAHEKHPHTGHITTRSFSAPEVTNTLEDVLEVVSNQVSHPVASRRAVENETHVCIRVLTFSRGVYQIDGTRSQHSSETQAGLHDDPKMRGKLTTARVAQIVDVAEATWVLYFFIRRLRVESSMIQGF